MNIINPYTLTTTSKFTLGSQFAYHCLCSLYLAVVVVVVRVRVVFRISHIIIRVQTLHFFPLYVCHTTDLHTHRYPTYRWIYSQAASLSIHIYKPNFQPFRFKVSMLNVVYLQRENKTKEKKNIRWEIFEHKFTIKMWRVCGSQFYLLNLFLA